MMVFLSLIISPTLRSKFAVCKQTTGSVQTFSTTAVGKSFVLVDMVVSTGIIRGYGWYMWMCLFWLLVFLCCTNSSTSGRLGAYCCACVQSCPSGIYYLHLKIRMPALFEFFDSVNEKEQSIEQPLMKLLLP